MANLSVGDVTYVDYGDGVYHVRLMGCQIHNDNWAIITPDHDVYDEVQSGDNPDYVSWIYGGPGLGSAVPPRVPPARVYGFGALTAAEYQQLLSQARIYAAGARALLGHPPVPAPGAAPVVAAAAAPVAPIVEQDPEVWVSLEDEPPYVRGQIVSDPQGQVPVGHVLLGGNKALVPLPAGAIAVKKIRKSQLSSFEAKDIRVLPIKFDAQGKRHRDFSDAVSTMTQDKMPGGNLQLEGPATSLDVLKSLASRSLTLITDHERWIRNSEISKNDRSIYEMEVIAKVLEAFIMTDQLNLPNLKGGELLLRRWQLIKEAHRIAPHSPDYSSAEHFMGWDRESGVQTDLSKYVSERLKEEAAIAKESRKAREEQSHRGRGRGGRGQDRGRGGQNPSAETG
jgi:hypothetical protein